MEPEESSKTGGWKVGSKTPSSYKRCDFGKERRGSEIRVGLTKDANGADATGYNVIPCSRASKDLLHMPITQILTAKRIRILHPHNGLPKSSLIEISRILNSLRSSHDYQAAQQPPSPASPSVKKHLRVLIDFGRNTHPQ